MSQIARVLNSWAIYIFSAKESLVTLKFRSEKKDALSKYPALFIPTINHLNIYLSMLQTI